jgi:hypothetical protein
LRRAPAQINTSMPMEQRPRTQSRLMIWIPQLLLLLSIFSYHPAAVAATQNPPSAYSSHPFLAQGNWRGGAASPRVTTKAETETTDAYKLLAKAVRARLKSEGEAPELSQITKAFKSLSSAQKTFKGLDGAAHEAYQRTHTSDEVDISVSGRARRSAARAGAAADGLGACELCELGEFPERFSNLNATNGTLANRQVLLNVTEEAAGGAMGIRILVLYEPLYQGGSGVDHGGLIDDTVPPSKRAKGRLLVILSEAELPQLQRTFKVLDRNPMHVRLQKGLVTNEIASVQPVLYKTAGSVLTAIEPILRSHSNASAIHFTGRSLAGGVSAIAASILHGSISLPGNKKKRQSETQPSESEDQTDQTSSPNATETNQDDSNSTLVQPLQGLGKDRTSAVTLGAPPSVSANVETDFVTSILYGDDIVCRASKDSIDRFIERTTRALKYKGILGSQMNKMRDTISLATSNIKSHAVGSEGEEKRLSVPGRAYLVRPRRLGGTCSMHEVGAQLKGGREALRAAVLWQVNDILLSKSMWKHHDLEFYILGLDRSHLRGIVEEDDGDDNE